MFLNCVKLHIKEDRYTKIEVKKGLNKHQIQN